MLTANDVIKLTDEDVEPSMDPSLLGREGEQVSFQLIDCTYQQHGEFYIKLDQIFDQA